MRYAVVEDKQPGCTVEKPGDPRVHMRRIFSPDTSPRDACAVLYWLTLAGYTVTFRAPPGSIQCRCIIKSRDGVAVGGDVAQTNERALCLAVVALADRGFIV